MSKNWWSFETTESCYIAQQILKNLIPRIADFYFNTSRYAWKWETRAALDSIHPFQKILSDAVEKATILSGITALKKSLQRIIPDYSELSVLIERKNSRILQDRTLNSERILSISNKCEKEYDSCTVVPTFLLRCNCIVLVFNRDRAENTE